MSHQNQMRAYRSWRQATPEPIIGARAQKDIRGKSFQEAADKERLEQVQRAAQPAKMSGEIQTAKCVHQIGIRATKNLEAMTSIAHRLRNLQRGALRTTNYSRPAYPEYFQQCQLSGQSFSSRHLHLTHYHAPHSICLRPEKPLYLKDNLPKLSGSHLNKNRDLAQNWEWRWSILIR